MWRGRRLCDINTGTANPAPLTHAGLSRDAQPTPAAHLRIPPMQQKRVKSLSRGGMHEHYTNTSACGLRWRQSALHQQAGVLMQCDVQWLRITYDT